MTFSRSRFCIKVNFSIFFIFENFQFSSIQRKLSWRKDKMRSNISNAYTNWAHFIRNLMICKEDIRYYDYNNRQSVKKKYKKKVKKQENSICSEILYHKYILFSYLCISTLLLRILERNNLGQFSSNCKNFIFLFFVSFYICKSQITFGWNCQIVVILNLKKRKKNRPRKRGKVAL